MLSANIGAFYDAHAEGKGHADWQVALTRHELIDEVYAGAYVGSRTRRSMSLDLDGPKAILE
jgi:hypothetical protein